MWEGPPRQIARPQSGRPFTAPPLLRRPVGLHLRLTHPALPTVTVRDITYGLRTGFDPPQCTERHATPEADAPDPSYRPMGGEEMPFASFTPGSGS
ncbi:hypothetical protein GCM10018780_72430 [Streptomyces lanatus]|nr:hypothetical protein GCM10018780_72430 [Streptomyces lanatus]